jgi:cytochrome b561
MTAPKGYARRQVNLYWIGALLIGQQCGGAPAIEGGGAVQRVLSNVTHLGLFAVMILLPISGWVVWFGGIETAAQGRNILEMALLALMALYVVGALHRQFVLKVGLMDRMRHAEG